MRAVRAHAVSQVAPCLAFCDLIAAGRASSRSLRRLSALRRSLRPAQEECLFLTCAMRASGTCSAATSLTRWVVCSGAN